MEIRYFFRARLWVERPPGFSVLPWAEKEEACTSLPKCISLSDGWDEISSSS